jgi:peptidoglycan/LPS O-acetylase OafA/YrhL
LTYNYEAMFRERVFGSDYRRFVWDRWAKIYPVHLVMLLAILPIQLLSPNLPLDWRAVPFHLLLLQCFWPVTHPTFFQYLNVPSWSISCELFFYLLAPVAIMCAIHKTRRWMLLAAVMVYAGAMGAYLARQPDFPKLYLVSWFAPSRFPEFLAGVFLAVSYLRGGGRTDHFAGLRQAAGILLIVGGALYRPQAPWVFWGGLLYAPGAVLLVSGLASGRGWLVRHLSRPSLRQLGNASFCLYLMQAPIMRACRGVCLIFGWQVRSWFGFILVSAAMFLLVQTCAFAMHYWYEMPLQRALRSLIRRVPGDAGIRHSIAHTA